MRAKFVWALILTFATVSQASAVPSLAFVQGTTNEATEVGVSFKLTDCKLPTANWLVTFVVNGQNIDVSKCTLGQKDQGTTGVVAGPLTNLKAGKYKVMIKVKLSDDTTLEKTADVANFGSPGNPRRGLLSSLRQTTFCRSL
jgi:hypothetical protein